MYSNFIHLHSHSEYSLDIGFFSIGDYVRYCHENKFISAVITERFNLYSSIKFYKECENFSIKPIIGCEFFLEHNLNEYSRILILCKNKNGYQNLLRLISKAHTNNIINGIPILKYEWFLNINDGLIIIGLSFESDIGISLINDKYKTAIEFINFWTKIFKNNYYLSISKFGIPAESVYLDRLFNLKNIKDLALVAINEICFLRKKDFISYKSKIAMFDQERRIILDTEDTYFKNKYFKNEKEMFLLFEKEKNSLYNTLEITKRCNFKFNFKADYAPKYLKNKNSSNANILIKESLESLVKKLTLLDINDWKYYIKRLIMELKIITRVGFENYFLITYDFILWAKKNDIYVGPGRGSCSGSLVAYFLNITSIDPIKYNLLFERFLNKDRLSKPDFDIDFCIENRDLIIDYIYDEYKLENVAKIITYGCMNIKAVIRDIGRMLGYSYTFVNKLAKLLSNDIGISLKSEIIHNQNFKNEYDASYDIQKIINLSLKLEGIIKNIGTHAGGLVISPIKLITNIPLSLEEDSPLTQFDKNDSESIGFVKFDFLGLKNLTVIASIFDSISSYKSIFETNIFIIDELILNDKRTFELLQKGDTTGIFQLESYGIKSVIQKMKPNSFLDISALIALYRPGPLQSGMLTSFIKRRLGIEKIDYIHPRLKKILDETYGMIVYQEQVMLIAQIFSGYDLSLADFLRIAMSKKKNDEMLTHLEHFSNGAEIYKIDRETAKNVFYLVEKFAGYGFNKAHSVGYAYLTYNMAWLKANYTCIFISSLLSSDMYNHDNLDIFIKDAIHFNIKILTPDINRSFYNFTIHNKINIRYGFGALKNIGSTIIADILNNRSIFGPFKSFLNFLNRIEIETLSKKILQNLIYSGVFDKLNYFKFKLVLITAKVFDIYFNLKKTNLYKRKYSIDDYFKKIKKNFVYITSYKQNENKELNKLFPESFITTKIKFYKHEYNEILKLSYKSGIYSNIFILGIIKHIQIKKYLNEKVIIIHLTSINKIHKIEISYDRYLFIKDLITKNKILVFCCYLNNNALKELFIEDFYIFRAKFVKFLDIILINNFITNNFLKSLFNTISSNFIKGPTTIRFKIIFKNKIKIINLNFNLKILIHDDTLNNLKKFKEIKKLKLIYDF
ncbi:MAG TPA: DNA polymerase III subunit alpha [Candidatus Azoamicus sp.]